MKKEDWIEILSTMNNRDWTDWMMIGVSVISPIIVLVSVIYVAKTAKITKEATDLNYKMYIEQKEEREKSFLPIFKVSNFISRRDFISFEIINHNTNKIVVTNYGVEESIESFDHQEYRESSISISVIDDFENKDYFKLWLYYTTLDHRNYCSEIIFKIVEQEFAEELIIYSNKTTNKYYEV
ncbi:hypothetical protein AM499_06885 [Bacillus sp. FJAT-22090]|uniref:hypothetical protein n=1 Tax=Bacillus sp. FJAT-22090 TaxID=1581038 RepID=UPI0006AD9A4D|nr:hypothetical protein [Bacillus sp. FJAT-22090]ALC85576.1 hypothetical protein AM499_06885 [Bacillus sp. FJAT-22090]